MTPHAIGSNGGILGLLRRAIYSAPELIDPSKSHVFALRPKFQFCYRQLILKYPDPLRAQTDTATDLQTEALMLGACRRHNLPAPVLLQHSSDYKWILMTFVDGVPIREKLWTDSPSSVIRQHWLSKLATLLADVHRLLSSDQTLRHTDLPRRTSAVALSLLEDRISSQPAEFRAVASPLLDMIRRAAPVHENMAVVHGDCSAYNILVLHDGKLALIDWENAGLAPVESELAFVTSWANGICRNSLEANMFMEHYLTASGRALQSFAYYCAMDSLMQAAAAQSMGRDSMPFVDIAREKLQEIR